MTAIARALAVLAGLLAAPAAMAGGLRPLAPPGPLDHVRSWSVFYGAEAPAERLRRPDLLVLEPDHPWEPARVRREGQLVLAYLSLGEVHRTRAYFPRLASAGALAARNPNWPDAVMIDPRAEAWHALVLEAIAPAILARGYDGFFLDTLDVGAHLERQGSHPGARAAMARLLAGLHARHPRALLLANGGLDLLPEAASALAGVAVESVHTDYQFQPARYRLRAEAEAAERASRLRAVSDRHGLRVFVIEYADPQDARMQETARRRALADGFVPFVADIDLTTL